MQAADGVLHTHELFPGLLDGVAPTELIGWGDGGWWLRLDGLLTVVPAERAFAAAALEFDEPTPGFALRHEQSLEVYGLGVESNGGALIDDPAPNSVAAIRLPGLSTYAHWRVHGDWSQVFTHPADQAGAWVIAGAIEGMVSADLDGDGLDELAFNYDVGVSILRELGQPTSCMEPPTVQTVAVARAVAVGDFDGDGDDELGLLTPLGEVALLDGG